MITLLVQKWLFCRSSMYFKSKYKWDTYINVKDKTLHLSNLNYSVNIWVTSMIHAPKSICCTMQWITDLHLCSAQHEKTISMWICEFFYDLLGLNPGWFIIIFFLYVMNEFTVHSNIIQHSLIHCDNTFILVWDIHLT